MIIEFFGLPGAGKTTLAKKIEESTDFKIVKINNRAELVWLNLVFLFKNPINFFILFLYILLNSYNWRMFYYKFVNLFLQTNAKFQKSLKMSKSLLDQCYFQSIISIFEKPVSEKEIKKILRFVYFPDKLVIFDINYQTMLERIKGKRFIAEEFGEDYLRSKIVIMHKNFLVLREGIKNSKLDFLIKDFTQNINILLEDVLNFVKN
mgnify:CR=1 FL=1